MRKRVSLTALGAAAVLCATPLTAQQAAPTEPPSASSAPKQVLSIQPISIIIGLYMAEYERVISRSTTFGVGASYFAGLFGEDNELDDRYLSAEAKVRYYPGGRPLRGFSFGGTLGFTSVSYLPFDDAYFTGSGERETTSGLKAGFELDHNWLLGRDEKFAVALGLGAKRLLISDRDGRDYDLALAYPTARVSVGLAF